MNAKCTSKKLLMMIYDLRINCLNAWRICEACGEFVKFYPFVLYTRILDVFVLTFLSFWEESVHWRKIMKTSNNKVKFAWKEKEKNAFTSTNSNWKTTLPQGMRQTNTKSKNIIRRGNNTRRTNLVIRSCIQYFIKKRVENSWSIIYRIWMSFLPTIPIRFWKVCPLGLPM